MEDKTKEIIKDIDRITNKVASIKEIRALSGCTLREAVRAFDQYKDIDIAVENITKDIDYRRKALYTLTVLHMQVEKQHKAILQGSQYEVDIEILQKLIDRLK